jgi:hypothetical protein
MLSLSHRGQHLQSYKSLPADKIANLAHNNRSLTCAEKAEAGTHMNISVFPFGRLGG